MLNKYINKIIGNIHIFILFIISIIPFLITSNKDFDFFIGYENFDLINLFQVWIDKDLGIIPAYQAPVYFVYHWLISLFGHRIGSSMIWIALIITGSVFLIFLFRELIIYLKISKISKIKEFIIGLSYIAFIPIQYSVNSPFSFNLIYPFSLILFYLFFKFINNENKSILKTSIILSLVSFIFLGLQIVFIIFLLLNLFIISIYFILNDKLKIVDLIKLLSLTMVIYLLITFPYYYTSVFLPYTTQTDLVNEILTIENLSFTQSNSFLTEVYKILGGTSYYYFHKGEYSIPSAVDYFKNPIYITLSYLGIISFVSFLIFFSKKYNKVKILLLTFFLITIFFMAGINNVNLFSEIYTYLYDEYGIFSMFRNGTKISFMLIIVYGLSIGFIVRKINNKKIHFFIIIALIIFNKPLYSKDFYKYANIQKPLDVKYSIEYLNDLNERALIVPITPFPVYTFSSRGVNPYEFVNEMKIIYNVNSAGVLTKLLKDINSTDIEINMLRSELNKMNIKYIIWNRYLDTKQYDLKDTEEYLEYYQNNFKEIKNINNNIIIFEI